MLYSAIFNVPSRHASFISLCSGSDSKQVTIHVTRAVQLCGQLQFKWLLSSDYNYAINCMLSWISYFSKTQHWFNIIHSQYIDTLQVKVYSMTLEWLLNALAWGK